MIHPPQLGADTRPWLRTSHEIRFNADLMDTGLPNYMWWDSTPATADDQPFVAWDALTVARHEIGHMLGFASGLYWDNIQSGSTAGSKLWEDLITTAGSSATFDQGGLDVAMASSGDLFHVADSGDTKDDLMVPALVNGQRREISATNSDMLAMAYDYVQIPEPGTSMLAFGGLLIALGRWRRAA